VQDSVFVLHAEPGRFVSIDNSTTPYRMCFLQAYSLSLHTFAHLHEIRSYRTCLRRAGLGVIVDATRLSLSFKQRCMSLPVAPRLSCLAAKVSPNSCSSTDCWLFIHTLGVLVSPREYSLGMTLNDIQEKLAPHIWIPAFIAIR
jgi:hypothetical protein